MNLADIKVVLSDQGIPNTLRVKIVEKATKLIKDEFEVEVIVGLRAVTMDVYENGVRVDREIQPYRTAEEVRNLIKGE